MNTLKLNLEIGKKQVIKQVNKFRLSNKNKWYQIEVTTNNFIYQLKVFGTWVQIGKKRFLDTKELIHNYPSNMDISVKEFKEYLTRFIND